jgi:hypothetical protein
MTILILALIIIITIIVAFSVVPRVVGAVMP